MFWDSIAANISESVHDLGGLLPPIIIVLVVIGISTAIHIGIYRDYKNDCFSFERFVRNAYILEFLAPLVFCLLTYNMSSLMTLLGLRDNDAYITSAFCIVISALLLFFYKAGLTNFFLDCRQSGQPIPYPKWIARANMTMIGIGLLAFAFIPDNVGLPGTIVNIKYFLSFYGAAIAFSDGLSQTWERSLQSKQNEPGAPTTSNEESSHDSYVLDATPLSHVSHQVPRRQRHSKRRRGRSKKKPATLQHKRRSSKKRKRLFRRRQHQRVLMRHALKQTRQGKKRRRDESKTD